MKYFISQLNEPINEIHFIKQAQFHQNVTKWHIDDNVKWIILTGCFYFNN